MKNTLYFKLALAAGIIISSPSFAQKKNAVKFNLLSPIVKTGSFFYERDLSELVSAQLGFLVTDFKVAHADYSGYGITPEIRIYPAKMENLKVYLAPFVRYQNANLKTVIYDEDLNPSTEDATYSKFGGGILFGGKFLFNDFAVLDIFIGPVYNSGNIDIETGAEENFAHFDLALGLLSDLGVRIGIAVGIIF